MIIAYATTLAHRVWLMGTALRNDATIYVPDEVARALPDHELPVYTVLVPAYREPEVVSKLVAASSAALEYPADRLEVRLLLEADDAETIAAAGASRARATTSRSCSSRPASRARSPRRATTGCTHADGEFVTIYDAEDHPEPLQLRRAVVAFRQVGADVACLQAKLATSTPTRTCSPAGSPPSTTRGSAAAARPGLRPARRSRWAARRTTSAGALLERRRLGPVQRHRGRRPRASACTGRATGRACSTRRRSRRPTPTSSTGSSSARAGTRATCRPGWCTCADPSCCIASWVGAARWACTCSSSARRCPR